LLLARVADLKVEMPRLFAFSSSLDDQQKTATLAQNIPNCIENWAVSGYARGRKGGALARWNWRRNQVAAVKAAGDRRAIDGRP